MRAHTITTNGGHVMFRHGPDKWARAAAVAVLLAVIALVATPAGGARAATPPQSSGTVLEWNLHAVNAFINAPSALTRGRSAAAVRPCTWRWCKERSPTRSHDHRRLPAPSRRTPGGTSVGLAGGRGRHGRPRRARRIGPGSCRRSAAGRRPPRRPLCGRARGDRRCRHVPMGRGRGPRRRRCSPRARRRPLRPFSFTRRRAGQWPRPRQPGDPFAWVARVEPFLIESPSQFRTQGPHALTSDAYAEEYDEVKALGAKNGARGPPSRRPSPSSTPSIRSRCSTAPSAPSPWTKGSRSSSRRGCSRC